MEHIQRVVPQIIIPKISELASNFIRDNDKTSYLLANSFHKQLTDTVYNGMKKQIKELEAHLYKEQILPREEELNKTY